MRVLLLPFAVLLALRVFAGDSPAAKAVDLGKGVGDRYALSAVFDASSRRLLAWGGETNVFENGRFTRFVFHDGFRVFDIKSGAWTDLKADGAAPSKRAYAGMALAERRRRVYLFGGFDPKFLNDMWEYTLDKNTWRQIEPKGPVPGVRDAMGCTFDEATQTLWIFGGLASFQPMKGVADLWKWDAAENRWTEIKRGEGAWPEARFLASFHAIGNGKALLYGGYAGSGRGVFGDLWELDLKTGTWTKLPAPPAPRAAAASLWNPAISRLVVLNGIERGDTSSVQLYDPAGASWTTAGQTGIAKSYAASACDPKSGDVYLLGGVVGGFFGTHAPDRLVRVSFAPRSKRE